LNVIAGCVRVMLNCPANSHSHLVVRRTFLEVIHHGEGDSLAARTRASSDPARKKAEFSPSSAHMPSCTGPDEEIVLCGLSDCETDDEKKGTGLQCLKHIQDSFSTEDQADTPRYRAGEGLSTPLFFQVGGNRSSRPRDPRPNVSGPLARTFAELSSMETSTSTVPASSVSLSGDSRAQTPPRNLTSFGGEMCVEPIAAPKPLASSPARARPTALSDLSAGESSNCVSRFALPSAPQVGNGCHTSPKVSGTASFRESLSETQHGSISSLVARTAPETLAPEPSSSNRMTIRQRMTPSRRQRQQASRTDQQVAENQRQAPAASFIGRGSRKGKAEDLQAASPEVQVAVSSTSRTKLSREQTERLAETALRHPRLPAPTAVSVGQTEGALHLLRGPVPGSARTSGVQREDDVTAPIELPKTQRRRRQRVRTFHIAESLSSQPAEEEAEVPVQSSPSKLSPAGQEEDSPPVQEGERTTVMLQHMPSSYTRSMVQCMIDDAGFAGQYDFVYVPMDFMTRACYGYAFINFTYPSHADRFWNTFNGFSQWSFPSRKTCRTFWSKPHQGLEANIARYRNSPVMHKDVPDEYKPILLTDGVRTVFPPPTKTIRLPRLRNYSPSFSFEKCN